MKEKQSFLNKILDMFSFIAYFQIGYGRKPITILNEEKANVFEKQTHVGQKNQTEIKL